MAGEIAAVDRRYVLRLESIAVPRVVPIVEVAAETLEAFIVSSVASRRSTVSSVPTQPKSRAATVDNRYSPMFVGDVRCATIGLGVSWKLSGGNAWSSAPTNVAKNRHVRRATRRRSRASAADSGRVGAVLRGTLIQRATAGDAIHRSSQGSAAGQASGRPHAPATAAAEASATPPPIRRQKPRRS